MIKSPHPHSRRAKSCALAALLLTLTACASVPGAHKVEQLSPDAQRVAAALAQWPAVPRGGALQRTFFATIHAAGQRTTASGILDYYGPRDFRITAVTEMGTLLFDARMNWAGITVRRHMAGLDAPIVQTLVADLARAFDLPENLDGLAAGKEKMILKHKRGDERTTTWIFDRGDGHLLQSDVQMGLLDTLHIEYRRYTPQGWPADLYIQRKARLYDISLTFTEMGR